MYMDYLFEYNFNTFDIDIYRKKVITAYCERLYCFKCNKILINQLLSQLDKVFETLKCLLRIKVIYSKITYLNIKVNFQIKNRHTVIFISLLDNLIL